MQTDKPITELDDGINNVNIWNKYLEERRTKEGENECGSSKKTVLLKNLPFNFNSKQAGAELCQAQIPTGICLYFD